MIKDKRNIDTLFEEGLKKFKEQPPVYAWDKLDKGLDKAGFRKSLIYLRWMAASILIILAFGAGYYYAVYSLSPPEVVDEINLSIPSEKQTEIAMFRLKRKRLSQFLITQLNSSQINYLPMMII